MKPEYKIEGNKLLIKVSESASVDKDQDGVPSVEGSFGFDLKLDGFEIMDELLKSSDFVQKAKEKLVELGLVQA